MRMGQEENQSTAANSKTNLSDTSILKRGYYPWLIVGETRTAANFS